MIEQYLIYAEGNTVCCKSEAEALKEGEAVLRARPDINELGIYKLQKIGKRQSTVAWKTGSELPPETPRNGGGHYRIWTADENSYLVGARKAGFSYEEIAEDLGRTKHAVEVQASRLRQPV